MSKKIWMVPALALGLLAGCAQTADKPAAAPATKAAEKDAGVEVAVGHWATAWQTRDIEKYLAAYAKDFKPEKGSRADWEKQRKARIGKAKEIKLKLADLAIKMPAPDKATATFMQTYKSDTYSDKGVKVLELRKTDGQWLITREYMP
jgi:outer membrane protein, adhesin transport system